MTEQYTNTAARWEVLDDTGDVWHVSAADTAEQAAAEAREHLQDLHAAWAEIEAMGRQPRRRAITLAGIRRRTVTTVETVEIGQLQPIPESDR